MNSVYGSGNSLPEVIDTQAELWDCPNIRFHRDMGWKDEHGVGFTNLRHDAQKGRAGLGMW